MSGDNDEARMTKVEGSLNNRMTNNALMPASSFVFCHYFVIRHSSFVISL